MRVPIPFRHVMHRIAPPRKRTRESPPSRSASGTPAPISSKPPSRNIARHSELRSPRAARKKLLQDQNFQPRRPRRRFAFVRARSRESSRLNCQIGKVPRVTLCPTNQQNQICKIQALSVNCQSMTLAQKLTAIIDTSRPMPLCSWWPPLPAKKKYRAVWCEQEERYSSPNRRKNL